MWQKDDRIRKSPLKFYVYYYSDLSGDCQASIITELWRLSVVFLCYFMAHEHLLKEHTYLHVASGDTPILEYRRLRSYISKLVTSRFFQKWCSSGVVSALLLQRTTDFTGFFRTFRDITVADKISRLTYIPSFSTINSSVLPSAIRITGAGRVKSANILSCLHLLWRRYGTEKHNPYCIRKRC